VSEAHLHIKFPPLINVTAEHTRSKFLLGNIVLEMEVRGRGATITMTREDAQRLAESILAALPKSHA
jgi:hypothetical protein